MNALSFIGDKIRGAFRGKVDDPVSNMSFELIDPNTREVVQVSQVVKCQNNDGSDYIRPISNGN